MSNICDLSKCIPCFSLWVAEFRRACLFVGLSAGLHENYWKDFHKTLMEGWSRWGCFFFQFSFYLSGNIAWMLVEKNRPIIDWYVASNNNLDVADLDILCSGS